MAPDPTPAASGPTVADAAAAVAVGPATRRAAVTVDELRTIGEDAGLVALGVTGVEPLTRARAALDERKAAGLHGGMQFTYRNPARSTEPQRLMDGVRSLVVGAWPYAGGDVEAPPPGPPAGRVARYATVDHYAELRQALEAVAERLRADGHRARVVADDNALVDRAAAVRAGLGWSGKNANVLVPGHGSWVLLGAVATDAALPVDGPVDDGCGPCRRCLDGCPTGAIVAPGVVDARRCLAWLVQAEGSFPEEHREALGARIYGCDDCQEVCPPTRRGPEARRRVPADDAWVDLLDLLDAGDEELLDRHGRWYVPRRDPRYLRRNALVALGNVADPGDDAVHRRLVAVASGPDELLAEHAGWALARLATRADDRDAPKATAEPFPEGGGGG